MRRGSVRTRGRIHPSLPKRPHDVRPSNKRTMSAESSSTAICMNDERPASVGCSTGADRGYDSIDPFGQAARVAVERRDCRQPFRVSAPPAFPTSNESRLQRHPVSTRLSSIAERFGLTHSVSRFATPSVRAAAGKRPRNYGRLRRRLSNARDSRHVARTPRRSPDMPARTLKARRAQTGPGCYGAREPER
jgi:hypothetical protein